REDVGGAVAGQVHPGADQAAAVRVLAAIDVARRVDERPAIEFGGDGDVERDPLRGHDALRFPRGAAVEGAVEGDRVRGVVVQGEIELAVRADERTGADGAAGTTRIVGAHRGELQAVVARARDAHAAAGRAAAGGVPGDVDAIAERRGRVGVGGDHRLIV